jgi:hypothetical protein
MDLELFVAETLRAILAGVSTIKAKDPRVAPELTGDDLPPSLRTYGSRVVFLADFDVAVTVTGRAEGEAGLSGGLIKVVEAKGNVSGSWEGSRVSRIKFSVPLDICQPLH